MTLDQFEQASEKVQNVILPTNLIYSEYYSAQTGGKIYLKPENMQYTGAYKVRGAYYKISTMSEEDRQKGLITASAGNHAQGVAYAAKLFGVKAVIVMPNTTPLIKVNRTKSYGAEVVLHGDVYDDACSYALQLAEEKEYTFIHPFDDAVLAGAVLCCPQPARARAAAGRAFRKLRRFIVTLPRSGMQRRRSAYTRSHAGCSWRRYRPPHPAGCREQ